MLDDAFSPSSPPAFIPLRILSFLPYELNARAPRKLVNNSRPRRPTSILAASFQALRCKRSTVAISFFGPFIRSRHLRTFSSPRISHRSPWKEERKRDEVSTAQSEMEERRDDRPLRAKELAYSPTDTAPLSRLSISRTPVAREHLPRPLIRHKGKIGERRGSKTRK